MKIQRVEYKEVVIAYTSEHNMRLINEIWSKAPFKFRQYSDIRNRDLVEVFVMPFNVHDVNIEKTIDLTLKALEEAAE